MGRQGASVKIGGAMPTVGAADEQIKATVGETAPEPGLGELNEAELPALTNGFAGLNSFPQTQETVDEQDVVRTTDNFGNVIDKIVSVRAPRVETPAEMQARVRSEDTDHLGNVITRF
jgi:hypothetical protein